MRKPIERYSLNAYARLRIAQARFRLAFKLHILHFDGKHRRQALSVVLSRKRIVLILEHSDASAIVVHHLGKRGFESRLVRSALRCRNVIHI